MSREMGVTGSNLSETGLYSRIVKVGILLYTHIFIGVCEFLKNIFFFKVGLEALNLIHDDDGVGERSFLQLQDDVALLMWELGDLRV